MEFKIAKSEGLRIFEEINLEHTILPRNHQITKDDITHLKAAGIDTVSGIFADENDLDFETALQVITAKICGKNLGFQINEYGFSELAAVQDGFLDCSPERVSKFNKFSPHFILNTIAPYQKVEKGEIVARLEILTPVISRQSVEELVYNLSGNTSLLNVVRPQKQNAVLLQTHFYHNDDETFHMENTRQGLENICQPLGVKISQDFNVSHNISDIADILSDILHSKTDIIFVSGAKRNFTEEDTLASAIQSITNDILCRQIPVIGGSDFMIATVKNKKIIVLPYNFPYLESPLLESYIKLAICKEKLMAADFQHPQNAVLPAYVKLKDISSLTQENSDNNKASNIAIIVLAAGQSKRAGENKLLSDIHDQPLILKTVEAAVQSNACPVFVITGYQSEEISEILAALDINIIYNPAFRMGIKTSINLGLQAVPGFCDGAILLPGDMPNVTPDLLNKMIAKFKKKLSKQLITAQKNGIKSNPVLWSRDLFSVADLVAENADIRPVFLEHSDYTIQVPASEHELLDVNFKNDLDTLKK